MSKDTITFDGLGLFHAMYAVGLAFGLQEISTTAYAFYRDSSSNMWVQAPIFFSILFIIVRFFWSVGNIRRAVDVKPDGKVRIPGWTVTLIHLPALLLQGTLILCVSLYYSDYQVGKASLTELSGSIIVVTLFNLFWLSLLKASSHRDGPEIFWISNNLIFSILGSILIYHLACLNIGENVFIILFFGLSILSSWIDLIAKAKLYIREGFA